MQTRKEEVNLSRTILAAACFILGSALLIPVSLRLWRFLAARLAAQETPYLPDAHTDFVLLLGGRAIDSVTVLVAAAALGAALLLAGLRMVR
jgi:hypothetical protein